MNKRQDPIAVFDSGAGGLSVLKQLVRIMPEENYIFLGDSLNAPYGVKATEEVRRLTEKNVDRLVEMGAKEVVVACNTATSAAIRPLREKYPDIPMIGLEPAIKPAAEEGGRVLVMATSLTLREEKLRRLMSGYIDKAEILLLPCPELVEFVESGITSGSEIEEYLHDILSPYIGNVNSIVLGCTHFPLAKKAIEAVTGDIKLFDGGEGAAREAKRRLEAADMRTDSKEGKIVFHSSLAGKEEMYKKLFDMQ